MFHLGSSDLQAKIDNQTNSLTQQQARLAQLETCLTDLGLGLTGPQGETGLGSHLHCRYCLLRDQVTFETARKNKIEGWKNNLETGLTSDQTTIWNSLTTQEQDLLAPLKITSTETKSKFFSLYNEMSSLSLEIKLDIIEDFLSEHQSEFDF